MAEKYDLRTQNEIEEGVEHEAKELDGEELLRQFMEEVTLLSDISENEK
jgi:hypothetical protein